MVRRALYAALLVCIAATSPASPVWAENVPADPCARAAPGSPVPEPHDLYSTNGILNVDLGVRDFREPNGATHYCYVLSDGSIAPTLRLHPGDLLVLRLRNDLVDPDPATVQTPPVHQHGHWSRSDVPAGNAPSGDSHGAGLALPTDPCSSGAMTPVSTNLHFHGLTVPPVCHQDDVLKTSIQPGDPPFEYRLRIPADEPPGLYWYHPHIHGFSSKQVSGGASGAMIIEGLERANPEVAGLPERVLVIRDQELVNPDAPPSKSEPVVPKMLIDRDGDSANNGTGFGKPARDLSVNFVPVPYPDYPPALIRMKPGERQLWRVVNASAITYLNLAVVLGRASQQLGVVAIDGVPMNPPTGRSQPITWVTHLGVPPGARVEFIMTGPPAGTPALFVTRTVDTGQGGENDPNRALASIVTADDALEPKSKMPAFTAPLPTPAIPWLGDTKPTRVRKLYFSEHLENPKDPNSATTFYITEDGREPAPFDPAASTPNIVAHQGDVEDWIIENRSTELHAFHIHQAHFMLVDWSGIPVNEPFLRDTVNVPYYSDRMLQYPSVRLRMDFRDPNTVGTFVYHCHLLEHEDGGMMGTIRVEPAQAAANTGAAAAGTSPAGSP